MAAVEPPFFMAKKQKPVQKGFKMKPFKVKRSTLKLPKIPKISKRKLK